MIQWIFKVGMAQFRLDERFDAIVKWFDRIDKHFDHMKQSFDRFESRVDHVEKRFEGDSKSETLASRKDTIDSVLPEHARRPDGIETKLDAAFNLKVRVAVLDALMGLRPAKSTYRPGSAIEMRERVAVLEALIGRRSA